MFDFFDAFFDDFYDEFFYDLAPTGSDKWIISFLAGSQQSLGSTLAITISRSCLQVTQTDSCLQVGPTPIILFSGVGIGIIGINFRVG